MLPHQIRAILKNNRVCCLGTLDGDQPYLSTMTYTLFEPEDLLIMSSRTNSVKISNLTRNPHAAVLVSDASDPANPVSVSLSGVVRLSTGEEAQDYLRLHRETSSLHSPFIDGQDITVIAFKAKKAITSDQADNVTFWQDRK